MVRGNKSIIDRVAGDKKEEPKVSNPSSVTGEKGSAGVVHFWSTQSKYSVAVAPGKNVRFNKHVLVLGSSDPSIEVVRGLGTVDIKEVIDVPFTKDTDLAKFNKFLQGIVYSGERGTATRRGLVALSGLFNSKDDISAGADPDVLIMQVLKRKSFKEGI